tara:strand:+ start:153 stop:299 length:147 start_codon:yes stop_codon:yes gene_type:complete
MNPKVEMIFEIIEAVLLLAVGGCLLYILFGFSQGMEAWVELDNLMRGY